MSNKILGILMLVGGWGLLVVGFYYNKMFGKKKTEYTMADKTAVCRTYSAGIVFFLGGIYLLFFG